MSRWAFPEDRRDLRRWLKAPRRGYVVFYDLLTGHLDLGIGEGPQMMLYRLNRYDLTNDGSWRTRVAIALRHIRRAQRRAREKTW